MHNTTVFDYANNSFFDFIISTTTSTVPLWLIQNPNSRFAIRQAASSLYHINRVFTSSFVSSVDYSVANFLDIFDFLTGLKPDYFTEQSSLRFFKRLMLVLKRNGGVYEDLFEILSTLYRTRSLKYDEVLNSPTFFEIDKSRMISLREIKAIVEKELMINFDQTFSPIVKDKSIANDDMYQLSYYKDVTSLDCCLKESSDVNLTISVMPPHLQRMRNFDIFTLRLCNAIVGLIPFMDTYTNFFSSVINRLDWNLERERKARIDVLKAYNANFDDEEFQYKKRKRKTFFFDDNDEEIVKASIEFQTNPKVIKKMLQRSREIVSSSLPLDLLSTTRKSSIYVPAPIPSFCSDHVMITDIENHDDLYLSNTTVLRKLVQFTTQLYQYSSQVVPNCSISNVSIGSPSNFGNSDTFSKNSIVSLKRFGSLTKIHKDDVTNAGYLYAGYLLHNKNMFMKGTKYFGLGREVAQNLLNHNSQKKQSSVLISTKDKFNIITRAILHQKPDFALTASETMMSLTDHLWDTMDIQQKASPSKLNNFSALFKDYSLRFLD